MIFCELIMSQGDGNRKWPMLPWLPIKGKDQFTLDNGDSLSIGIQAETPSQIITSGKDFVSMKNATLIAR